MLVRVSGTTRSPLSGGGLTVRADGEEGPESLHHQGVIIGLRQAGNAHATNHSHVPDPDRKAPTVGGEERGVDAVRLVQCVPFAVSRRPTR